MTTDTLRATTTINAPAEVVFAVLADPTTHPSVEGTGWVRHSLDGERLTRPGQVFRMAMYHPNHPDGDYEMANRVEELEAPRTISWQPGQYNGDGTLQVGGWLWRYDLTPVDAHTTEVKLTYDWSAAPAVVRERIQFPPFPPEYLDSSLRRLAQAAESGAERTVSEVG
jgi:uncharacterized protein YndB with AHSA1/START domain